MDSERATIAERQGASENQNYEVKPTLPKTDSSGYFGILNKILNWKVALYDFPKNASFSSSEFSISELATERCEPLSLSSRTVLNDVGL